MCVFLMLFIKPELVKTSQWKTAFLTAGKHFKAMEMYYLFFYFPVSSVH